MVTISDSNRAMSSRQLVESDRRRREEEIDLRQRAVGMTKKVDALLIAMIEDAEKAEKKAIEDAERNGS